ncbi:MAG: ABC transporter substrate-binding protein, partial [Planctomycetota bacterium]
MRVRLPRPFSLLLVCLMSFAACSGEQERIVLRFLPWQEDYDFVGPLIIKYEHEHPGVEIRMLRAAEQNETLKTLLASGEPPDVFAIDVELFPAYHAVGALAPLDGHLEGTDFDESDYYPITLDAFRARGSDGRARLYALPKDCTPYVLYYNRQLFLEKGVEPPDESWTWEDLERAAIALCGPKDERGLRGSYGLSMNYWSQALMPWIWSSGGAVFDQDGRCVIDSPETIRALAFLRRLFDLGVTTGRVSPDAIRSARMSFEQGRVAMVAPAGRWVVNRVRDRNPALDFDVAPLPRGPSGQRFTALAETGYCLSSASRHPGAAAEFLRFLAGEEGAWLMAERGIAVPAVRQVAEGPAFLDPGRPPATDRVFLDELERARLNPTRQGWAEIKQIIREAVEDCLVTGRLSPEAACRQARSRIEALLERSRTRERAPPFPLGISAGLLALVLLSCLLLFLWMQRSRVPEERSERRAALLFLSPWALGFGLFLAVPVLVTL